MWQMFREESFFGVASSIEKKKRRFQFILTMGPREQILITGLKQAPHFQDGDLVMARDLLIANQFVEYKGESIAKWNVAEHPDIVHVYLSADGMPFTRSGKARFYLPHYDAVTVERIVSRLRQNNIPFNSGGPPTDILNGTVHGCHPEPSSARQSTESENMEHSQMLPNVSGVTDSAVLEPNRRMSSQSTSMSTFSDPSTSSEIEELDAAPETVGTIAPLVSIWPKSKHEEEPVTSVIITPPASDNASERTPTPTAERPASVPLDPVENNSAYIPSNELMLHNNTNATSFSSVQLSHSFTGALLPSIRQVEENQNVSNHLELPDPMVAMETNNGSTCSPLSMSIPNCSIASSEFGYAAPNPSAPPMPTNSHVNSYQGEHRTSVELPIIENLAPCSSANGSFGGQISQFCKNFQHRTDNLPIVAKATSARAPKRKSGKMSVSPKAAVPACSNVSIPDPVVLAARVHSAVPTLPSMSPEPEKVTRPIPLATSTPIINGSNYSPANLSSTTPVIKRPRAESETSVLRLPVKTIPITPQMTSNISSPTKPFCPLQRRTTPQSSTCMDYDSFSMNYDDIEQEISIDCIPPEEEEEEGDNGEMCSQSEENLDDNIEQSPFLEEYAEFEFHHEPNSGAASYTWKDKNSLSITASFAPCANTENASRNTAIRASESSSDAAIVHVLSPKENSTFSPVTSKLMMRDDLLVESPRGLVHSAPPANEDIKRESRCAELQPTSYQEADTVEKELDIELEESGENENLSKSPVDDKTEDDDDEMSRDVTIETLMDSGSADSSRLTSALEDFDADMANESNDEDWMDGSRLDGQESDETILSETVEVVLNLVEEIVLQQEGCSLFKPDVAKEKAMRTRGRPYGTYVETVEDGAKIDSKRGSPTVDTSQKIDKQPEDSEDNQVNAGDLKSLSEDTNLKSRRSLRPRKENTNYADYDLEVKKPRRKESTPKKAPPSTEDDSPLIVERKYLSLVTNKHAVSIEKTVDADIQQDLISPSGRPFYFETLSSTLRKFVQACGSSLGPFTDSHSIILCSQAHTNLAHPMEDLERRWRLDYKKLLKIKAKRTVFVIFVPGEENIGHYMAVAVEGGSLLQVTIMDSLYDYRLQPTNRSVELSKVKSSFQKFLKLLTCDPSTVFNGTRSVYSFIHTILIKIVYGDRAQRISVKQLLVPRQTLDSGGNTCSLHCVANAVNFAVLGRTPSYRKVDDVLSTFNEIHMKPTGVRKRLVQMDRLHSSALFESLRGDSTVTLRRPSDENDDENLLTRKRRR